MSIHGPQFNDVFKVNEQTFNSIALELFHYQSEKCRTYREYLDLIGCRTEKIDNWQRIPFLPIQFFKTQTVRSNEDRVQIIFESSSTTGQNTSKHLISHPERYHQSLRKSFEFAFAPPENFCFLALLPSYLERNNSSLVYMVNELMRLSDHSYNGFYLENTGSLHQRLEELKERKQHTILFGVSFALIDFVKTHDVINSFPELTIIETGGMKGRKREMIKTELHQLIKSGFPHSTIKSEYGMTEMLSQSYSTNNLFTPPPWFRVQTRAIDQPFETLGDQKTGGINFIDLANWDSCAFVATDDLGRTYKDGRFEVLGRLDHSDLRGCSLLTA